MCSVWRHRPIVALSLVVFASKLRLAFLEIRSCLSLTGENLVGFDAMSDLSVGIHPRQGPVPSVGIIQK